MSAPQLRENRFPEAGPQLLTSLFHPNAQLAPALRSGPSFPLPKYRQPTPPLCQTGRWDVGTRLQAPPSIGRRQKWQLR